MKGTILVTGGCGFIGSNFVRLVLRDHPDASLVNLDVLSYAGNPENLADVEDDPRYRFVRGDVADEELVDKLFAECCFDLVFHLAAESHVDRSILSSTPFVHANVLGTNVLLDAARKHGVGRFVHVSTDEVYGALGETGTFTESTPMAPNSPYAATKAASDLLVRAAFKTHGLDAQITRCSNNYGPYQFPEKIIPLFTANALEDKPLPVYGDGLYVREWIHAEDHCRALYPAALRNHQRQGVLRRK